MAAVVATAIVGVSGWLASKLDATIAVWIVVVAAPFVLGIGVTIGWVNRDKSDLPRYQADLLGEAMLALCDYAAGRLDIPFEDFVERGILGPARFGLSLESGEEVRLAILEPDQTGEAFRMVYESGHSLGRKENFSLPRTSLAGHALDSKELKWTDDVEDDERWQPHPKADKKRSYKSLASMPIVVGDEAVAVLNVISNEFSAFCKGDLTYIELLGAVIALAWDIELAAASQDRVASGALESAEGGS